MAQELLEIKNLTDGKIINSKGKNTAGDGSTSDLPLVGADKLTCSVTQFAETVDFICETAIAVVPGKNIQVTWGTDTNQRAAGGKLTKVEGKNYSITGLIDYSSIVVSLQGVLNIGANSKVSVKVGNADSPFNDKIIDLSSGGETKIDLMELIQWNKFNTGSETTLPEGISAQGFILYVNAFRYNVTRKTFKIDIRSGSGSKKSSFKIADGFELTDLGFLLTNEQNEPQETKALTE